MSTLARTNPIADDLALGLTRIPATQVVVGEYIYRDDLLWEISEVETVKGKAVLHCAFLKFKYKPGARVGVLRPETLL